MNGAPVRGLEQRVMSEVATTLLKMIAVIRKIISSLIKEERKKEEKKEAQASKDIKQIQEIFSTIIDEKRKPDPATKAASIDNKRAYAMAVQLRSIMQRKSKKVSDNDSDDEEE